jgi:hypothetical protein
MPKHCDCKITIENGNGEKINTTFKDIIKSAYGLNEFTADYIIHNKTQEVSNLQKILNSSIQELTPRKELWNTIPFIEPLKCGLSKTRGGLYRDSYNNYYTDNLGLNKAESYEVTQNFINESKMNIQGINIGNSRQSLIVEQEQIYISGKNRLTWRNSTYEITCIEHITMCNILNDILSMEDVPPFFFTYEDINKELAIELGYPGYNACNINVSPQKYIHTPEFSCCRLIDYKGKTIINKALNMIIDKENLSYTRLCLSIYFELFRMNIQFDESKNVFTLLPAEINIRLHKIKGIYENPSIDELEKKKKNMGLFDSLSEKELYYYTKNKNLVEIEEKIRNSYFNNEFESSIKNSKEYTRVCALIGFTSFCYKLRQMGVRLGNIECVPNLDLAPNIYPKIPVCDVFESCNIHNIIGGIEILNNCENEAWRNIKWKTPNPSNNYDIYNFNDYDNNFIIITNEPTIQYNINKDGEKQFIETLLRKNISKEFIDKINPYKFCQMKISVNINVKNILIQRFVQEAKCNVKEGKNNTVIVINNTRNYHDNVNGILLSNIRVDKNNIIHFETKISFFSNYMDYSNLTYSITNYDHGSFICQTTGLKINSNIFSNYENVINHQLFPFEVNITIMNNRLKLFIRKYIIDNNFNIMYYSPNNIYEGYDFVFSHSMTHEDMYTKILCHSILKQNSYFEIFEDEFCYKINEGEKEITLFTRIKHSSIKEMNEIYGKPKHILSKENNHLVKKYQKIKEDEDEIIKYQKQKEAKMEISDSSACKLLRSDREVVLNAVKKRGYDLKYASEELQNDEFIVMEAIKEDFFVFKIISEELKQKLGNNREFVLECVKKCGLALDVFPKIYDKDYEIILNAVKTYGNSLKFACEEFKNDRIIVMEAVKNWGCSLEYTSEKLKDDDIIVLESIRNNHAVLMYASERLQKKYLPTIQDFI